jgi:hypothetical protein
MKFNLFNLLPFARKPSVRKIQRQNLIPGKIVDISYYPEDAQVKIVRGTRILDIDEAGRLYLGQVSPELGDEFIGKEISVSFIFKHNVNGKGQRWLRYGYQSKLLIILEKPFENNDGNSYKSVLVFTKPENIKEVNLRMQKRFSLPEEELIKLFLIPDEVKLDIIDISSGGAKLEYPQNWSITVGQILKLLIIDRHKHRIILDAEILRTGLERDENHREYKYASVKFIDADISTLNELSKILHAMMHYN